MLNNICGSFVRITFREFSGGYAELSFLVVPRDMKFHFYCPHPKDGGRYCFQFVCQSTPRPGGGTPARSGWWGGAGGCPSQVWVVGGTPARSGWWGGGRGVPQLGLDGWGVPQPGLDGWGVPRPGLDGGGAGGCPSQVWMVGGYPSQVWMVGGTWGTPQPGLDGVPPPRLDGVPPHHDWMGYPLPTMTGWGTTSPP